VKFFCDVSFVSHVNTGICQSSALYTCACSEQYNELIKDQEQLSCELNARQQRLRQNLDHDREQQKKWRDAFKLINFKVRTRQDDDATASSYQATRDFEDSVDTRVGSRGQLNVLRLSDSTTSSSANVDVRSKAAAAATSLTSATSPLTQRVAKGASPAGRTTDLGLDLVADTLMARATVPTVERNVDWSPARSRSRDASDSESAAADGRNADEPKSVIDASVEPIAEKHQHQIAYKSAATSAAGFDRIWSAAGSMRLTTTSGQRWPDSGDGQNNIDVWAATVDDPPTEESGDEEISLSRGDDGRGLSSDGLLLTSVVVNDDDRNARRLPTSALCPTNETPRENMRRTDSDVDESNINGRRKVDTAMKDSNYVGSVQNIDKDCLFTRCIDERVSMISTDGGIQNRSSVPPDDKLTAAAPAVSAGGSDGAEVGANRKDCRIAYDGNLMHKLTSVTSKANCFVDRRIPKESCALAASRTASLISYSGDGDQYQAIISVDHLQGGVSTVPVTEHVAENEAGQQNVQRHLATIMKYLDAEPSSAAESEWSKIASDFLKQNRSVFIAQENNRHASSERRNMTIDSVSEQSDNGGVMEHCLCAEARPHVADELPVVAESAPEVYSMSSLSLCAATDSSMTGVNQAESSSHDVADGHQTQKKRERTSSQGLLAVAGGLLSGDGDDNFDRWIRPTDCNDKQCEETNATKMIECRLGGDVDKIKSRVGNDELGPRQMNTSGIAPITDESAAVSSTTINEARPRSDGGDRLELLDIKDDDELMSTSSNWVKRPLSAGLDGGSVTAAVDEWRMSGVADVGIGRVTSAIVNEDNRMTTASKCDDVANENTDNDVATGNGRCGGDERTVKQFRNLSPTDKLMMVDAGTSLEQLNEHRRRLRQQSSGSSKNIVNTTQHQQQLYPPPHAVSDSIEPEKSEAGQTGVSLMPAVGGRGDEMKLKDIDDVIDDSQTTDVAKRDEEFDESNDVVGQLTCDDPDGGDSAFHFKDVATAFPSEDTAGSTMNLLSFIGSNVASLQMVRPPTKTATSSGKRRHRNVRAATAAAVGATGGASRGNVASHNFIYVDSADCVSPPTGLPTEEASIFDGQFQRQRRQELGRNRVESEIGRETVAAGKANTSSPCCQPQAHIQVAPVPVSAAVRCAAEINNADVVTSASDAELPPLQKPPGDQRPASDVGCDQPEGEATRPVCTVRRLAAAEVDVGRLVDASGVDVDAPRSKTSSSGVAAADDEETRAHLRVNAALGLRCASGTMYGTIDDDDDCDDQPR
jgi:hypothetical protein